MLTVCGFAAQVIMAGNTQEPSMSKDHFERLDDIDRALLALLQRNARESAANLARKLGIARTTVTARIARLEQHHIITGYGVRLGKEVLDGSINAFVGITVQPKSGQIVLARLAKMPEIQLLCAVSGEFDYIAWLWADSPDRLDALLDSIGMLEGVQKTTTSIVLSRKVDRLGDV
jgi:DNA-binding Lrp family transcriptional regulator